VAYRVSLDPNVAAEVAAFPADTLRYWNASLSEIAVDPFPRFGLYTERVSSLPRSPMRTLLYEITREVSISGEEMFVFVAEFFAEYSIIYTVHGDEVLIFYLRQNR